MKKFNGYKNIEDQKPIATTTTPSNQSTTNNEKSSWSLSNFFGWGSSTSTEKSGLVSSEKKTYGTFQGPSKNN